MDVKLFNIKEIQFTKSGKLLNGDSNIYIVESPSKKSLFDAALYEINKRNKSQAELCKLVEILKENVNYKE